MGEDDCDDSLGNGAMIIALLGSVSEELLFWYNHKDDVGVGVVRFIEKNSGGGNTLGRRGVEEEEGGGSNSSLADTKLDVERDPNDDPPQQSFRALMISLSSSCNSLILGDGRRRGG